MNQDIDKLNGNDELSIEQDENGYDEHFGIPKTDFGKGMLVIRHTNYQNKTEEPVLHKNYLESVKVKTDTEVELCEEGDYEVALDYEIDVDNGIQFWKQGTYDYRIYFKFSVRNGNCMVYPFDVVTGAELTNSSITENGFYLDLAKSRYLNIDIKKEVRKDGAEGLTEDVRFNKPAKDGEKYTDEGIYTITVSNQYTNQTTTKVIYVGTDDVLKAHVATGLSISDVEYQLSMGATVAADGTLIPASEQSLPPAEPTNPNEENDTTTKDEDNHSEQPNSEVSSSDDASKNHMPAGMWLYAGGATLLAAFIGSAIAIAQRKKKRRAKNISRIDSADKADNGGDV